MKRLISALTILVSLPAIGQGKPLTPHLTAGGKVYIVSMDGFETDLAAAFQKKHVPLVIVDSKEKAEFILDGHNDNQKAGSAKTVFFSPAPAEHASVTIKDKDGDIVYAYAVDKIAARHGPQSAAEACAKHIKEARDAK